MYYSGISNTPFRKHMLEATMKQYIIPVVSLLAMLLRDVWFDGVTTDLNIHTSILENRIDENAEQKNILSQMHIVLMKLWTTSWRKCALRPKLIADPTETALALMTLNQDGTFKEPKDVTTIIAKLEYCMRLAFLKEIRACMEADTNMSEAAACDALEPWFTEKHYSTFSRLRSLQHKASAIAYETMGLPRIWWMDTKKWTILKYKGNTISFSDVCDMFQDMQKDLIFTWQHKVLRDLALRVDYQELVDDPSNTNIGYSFISDHKNTCFKDRSQMVKAVIAGEGAFSNFLLQQDGDLIWNRAALLGWLQDYAALHKLLLVCAEMLSGAPARGTELTAMVYRNTQTRSTRNLMVFGQHLTLLCQYSKTTSLMGHDKLIPHSLDAVTSDILIQDLALTRPFAQIAAKICFQDDHIVDLYKDLLFVNFNRKFTSEDLSTIMSKYSLPRVQYALTINPWRHIQTAWRRKFKCAVEDVVELDEMEDAEALQAGHTRATENRIYGLSTHSLAGAAEDILPLFLKASTSWQDHCQVPMGGQFIPYNQAMELSKNIHSFTENATHHQPRSPLFSGPASSMNIETDQIVDKVVERLTPMLTEVIQGINRLERRQTGRPSSPSLTREQKGKQKCTHPNTSSDEDVYDQHNNPYTATEDGEEDNDLQAAIHASIAASGKSHCYVSTLLSLIHNS